MTNKELENRKKKLDHLEEWKARHKKADDLIPLINREKEKTEWEIDALRNLPDEASDIPMGDIPVKFDRDLEITIKALPLQPEYNLSDFVTSSGTTTTTTSSVFSYVTRVGDIDTLPAIQFSEEFAGRYQEMQNNQKRPSEVRDLLLKIGNQNTINRLEVAEKSYEQYKSKINTRHDVANSFRNLLLGVKGDLWQKARTKERENMTWDLMAERLAKNGVDSSEYQTLLIEENENINLLSRLAKVLKDWEGGSLTNIDHLRTQALDHLYTILTIIEI